jgi:peptidoglycan hydrolase CwlO-like protein
MKTVDPKTQYYSRLITKLNDQESQIEKLQGEVETLQKTADEQRKALEEFLEKTNVE